MPDFSEDSLENSIINIFEDLGWQSQNCYEEVFGEEGTLGRETPADVVLVNKLRPKLEEFNTDMPKEAINQAIAELTRNRSMLSTLSANQEVYKLLKNGVKVEYRGSDGHKTHGKVRLVDWRNPNRNDYFLAKQFWISGERYKRRADLVGFINGIPLVFIEVKASHERIKDAYRDNLTDYKKSIPQIFWYNATIILSNGSEAKVGSVTSTWEYFNDWKRINDENEKGIIDVDTLVRGTCNKEKLLDIIENFILFTQVGGKPVKIFPKNHQYLGVNNVYNKFDDIRILEGKLGVFWHTQGSGKSVSMMALGQKVLRLKPGNWTFLIVTDRVDLDDQIYKNFADAGIVTESIGRVRAQSGEDLKNKLSNEDHRFLFTTIHKFNTKPGRKYPKLSDRDDVIVITDEAHRTEYGDYALNMRHALPRASFIGFTGTPLIGKSDEKTKETFGDYVSAYDFKQSVEDGATVPLYYENRLKKLKFENKEVFEHELVELIEKAELDSSQEEKLEREFSQEKHLIIRNDRLEAVAEDIVRHFMNRGFQGKAMVVSIDKATAAKMYDKVNKYWHKYIEDLRQKADGVEPHEKDDLSKTIAYMETVDMAVVVSPGQNEIEKMKQQGVDILPHRDRMNSEDLAAKFKDPKDRLQIVFLCAMWFTGFDVPHCSTLYLDKPIKDHTLMQTISRANRVYPGKTAGFIVDYISIFKSLKKALSIYGTGRGGGQMPIQNKDELVKMLRQLADTNQQFLADKGIDIEKMKNAETLVLISLLDEAVDAIVAEESLKLEFINHYNLFYRVYKAIMPDEAAYELSDLAGILRAISSKIQSLTPKVNIDEIRGDIEKLLDRSILPKSYLVRDPESKYPPIDISNLDVDKLKRDFSEKKKHIELERLKNAIQKEIDYMIIRNKTRLEWRKRFEKLLKKYNDGQMDMTSFFDQLLDFSKDLNKEDQRKIAEGLSEEELAVYDLLTKPSGLLSEEEKEQVKEAAKRLMERLKSRELVMDWRLSERNRARVKVAIGDELDTLPEDKFPKELFQKKTEEVYAHIYDSYWGSGQSVYAVN